MSWGALPGWVYDVSYQKHEARMLGAFQEELEAGFVRSLPEHVADLIRGKNVYDVAEIPQSK